MIRNALLAFSLALSTTACLDVENDNKRVVKSDDDDSDYDTYEEDDELPPGCQAQLQASDDEDCQPPADD